MKQAIVLCSGGVDSVTTAFYVKKKLDYEKIKVLFFNYAQKSLEREREYSKKCAEDIGAEFNEIQLAWLGEISNSLINKEGGVKKLEEEDLKNTKEESKKWYVPCRNLVFLSSAFSLAESMGGADIFVGFKFDAEGGYPDTTKDFVEKMNSVAKVCENEIKVIAPLIEKDKEDIIQLGKELGVNLKCTYSCYVGELKHCGTCLACQLRKAGFKWSGVEDTTEYITHFTQ